LLLSKRAQWNVDITFRNIDAGMSSKIGGIAGDVSGTFTVPHDPDLLRPILLHVAPA
jgi:hypothetical protein